MDGAGRAYQIRCMPVVGAAITTALLCVVGFSGSVRGQTPNPTAGTPGPPGAARSGTPAARTPDATTASQRQLCERYIAVLSGRERNEEMLEDPPLRALAAQVPALVTCGAVAADSFALCKLVSQWRTCTDCTPVGDASPKGASPKGCHRMLFIFHELRAHPDGRSFMLPFTREECATLGDLAANCVAFVDALRAGNASACGSAGAFQSLCQAFMTLDPSLCAPIEGLPADLPSACREMIASRGFLAKGLKTLADSGPPPDRIVASEFGDPNALRALAKAALGRSDACQPYAEPALKECLASSETAPAAADTPLPGTPQPATAPPATPGSQ